MTDDEILGLLNETSAQLISLNGQVETLYDLGLDINKRLTRLERIWEELENNTQQAIHWSRRLSDELSDETGLTTVDSDFTFDGKG